MSTDDLLARFAAEHFERHSISAERRATSEFTLRGLAARLGGRCLADLEPGDIMAWQGAELKRGLTPNTLRNRESMVRAFITWAGEAGVMDFEQTTRLKSVSPVRGARAHIRPRPYKRSELERFREHLAETYPLAPARGPGSRMVTNYLRGASRFGLVARNHARRLQIEAQVALALECGLRLEEFHGISLARLSPDALGVVVQTAKSEPGQEREREIPYTLHARTCVFEWLEFRRVLAPPHDRPWLALKYDDPLGAQSYELCKKSLPRGDDGKRYGWHRFRHTFATERLRAGVSLEVVQRMMGHATLSQTLAYAEIVNADVASQAERTEADFSRLLGLA